MQQKDDNLKRAATEQSQTKSLETWENKKYQLLSEYKDDTSAKALRRRQAMRHRQVWSFSLLILAVVLNIFSMMIVIFIGMGKLHFDTTWAVPSVIVANFAETWALTKIAMKFWFNGDNKDI